MAGIIAPKIFPKWGVPVLWTPVKILDIQILAKCKDKKVVGNPAPSESVNPTTGYVEIELGSSMKFSLAMDEDFEGDFTVHAKSPATGLILSEVQLTTDYM